jgi:hypothetical protein
MQAHTRPPTSLTRSLASLLSAPLVAFAAFIAGLIATSLVMASWDSDVVYVLCFGLAFLAGLFVTNKLCRSLAQEGEVISEAVVVRTLLCYAVAVALLSFVLVSIIHDLRS